MVPVTVPEVGNGEAIAGAADKEARAAAATRAVILILVMIVSSILQ
jgi:hypothetical protein